MMNKKNNRKNFLYRLAQQFTAFALLGLLLIACNKNDLIDESNKLNSILGKEAFSLDLNLGGGLDNKMNGEEYLPVEIDKTDSQLRAANINLKREGSTDGSPRKFNVEIKVDSGTDLPVVVACRITNGNTKRMFLGNATIKLSGTANRTFRIEQKGVKFHEVNNNGSIVQHSVDIADIANAKYEVKIFVGGSLSKKTGFDNVERYAIGYGMDNTDNRATLRMTDANGAVTFENIEKEIPFTSQWTKVIYTRNSNGENGVSNTEKLRLKADGSILMFSIANEMTDPNIELQNVRLYSERLTKNVAYVFDGNDLMARPAAFVKGATAEKEWYLDAELKPNVTLKRKDGANVDSRSFFVWAKQLGTDYLPEDKWTPTSVVAQIKETRKDGKKYWCNIPLLKTYDPLTKLHDGRVSKVALKFEDGMPVHPMGFFAKTYVWHTSGYDDTDKTARWRTGRDPGSSVLYGGYEANTISPIEKDGWDESYYIYFSESKAIHWKLNNVELEFGKVNPNDAYNSFIGSERTTYKWKVPSMTQLAALFPIGLNQDEINKTNSTSEVFIKEQAAIVYNTESSPDSDFWTILQRKGNITYAIRFLRKTNKGYYMTPFTAAYRYTQNNAEWWRDDRAEYWTQPGKSAGNQIDIRMRQLGSNTYQYDTNEGLNGYYSPEFSEARLRELFKIVKEESRTHPDWWNTNPLRGDDIVRIYPALGMQKRYKGDIWWVANHVCIGTVDGRNNAWNIFKFGMDNGYRFDWYSNTDRPPLVLYADRPDR